MKKNNILNKKLPNYNLAKKRINSGEILDYFKLNKNTNNSIGQNKTYFVRTYGCQSNVRDSEVIKGILEQLGFKSSNDIIKSDLVILNTCAIRENAELKVFGEIGYLKKIKKSNPNFIFGISGCMSQEENVVKKIIEKIDHIDFVIGTHNIHCLSDILIDVINNKKQVIDVWSKEGDIIENLPSVRDCNHKAFVTIMHGCDHFCTYCIVPYTRGKIRSRKKDDIINEINKLIFNGCKEVTLIGQNVNSYGLDLKEKYNFANLLDDIAKLNIKRIRFATSNPWNFDSEIIDVAIKNKNIMPYFHLPIQSGDENMLIKMNRKMEIKKYLNIINDIKNRLPESAISTDIIVGFPNETKEEFLNTLKLYEKIKFDNAYTFIFSPKEGTPAAKIIDELSSSEKEERLQLLNEYVKKYAKENNEKCIGKTYDVMIDGFSKTNRNKLTGYTPQWKVVNFSGSGEIGEIVKVKIISVSRFSLNGEKI